MLLFNSGRKPSRRYDLIFRLDSGDIDAEGMIAKAESAARI